MDAEYSKIGSVYHLKNKTPADRCINVLITASLHGNEVIGSVMAHNIFNYFKFSNFPATINELTVYPFVNKNGIRARTRDLWVNYANLNDAWDGIEYRNSLKQLIDARCGEQSIPTLVIDIHNSPNIVPCFALESTDPNTKHIEFILDKYNEQAPGYNCINKLKRHTDIGTLKSYVNRNYSGNAFGVTFECTGMRPTHKNYIIAVCDKITNFIRFVSENFNLYMSEPGEDFNPCELAVNLTAPASGILEFDYIREKSKSGILAGETYEEGDIIATIMSIDPYIPIAEIKAPCYGMVASICDELYLNIGETFGNFQPLPEE